MCKYCENGIRFEVYSESGLNAEIETRRGIPYISIWTTIDGGYFGYADIEGDVEINYCPMCGRALAEVEETEKGVIRNEFA